MIRFHFDSITIADIFKYKTGQQFVNIWTICVLTFKASLLRTVAVVAATAAALPPPRPPEPPPSPRPPPLPPPPVPPIQARLVAASAAAPDC